jgi:hypothetical protein
MDIRLEKTFEDPSITSEADREKHYWQKDHVRLFGMDYGQRLEQAGFTVTADRFVMEMDPASVQRYALPTEEIIYFCRKI